MTFHDSVVLLTGGARMGLAIARRLGPHGARIIFTARKTVKPLEEAVRELETLGIRASMERCDVARAADLRRLASRIEKQYGRLDGLVHLASIYEKSDIRRPESRASLQRHQAIHVEAALDLVRSLGNLLTKSGRARVVLISDWTAASGRPRYKGYTPYYISKRAVQGAVEALALELAPAILVNGIAPGPILPPPDLPAAARREVERATPVGRWGGAEEIAKAVEFLLMTDFVTGETIRVDGGRHLL